MVGLAIGLIAGWTEDVQASLQLCTLCSVPFLQYHLQKALPINIRLHVRVSVACERTLRKTALRCCSDCPYEMAVQHGFGCMPCGRSVLGLTSCPEFYTSGVLAIDEARSREAIAPQKVRAGSVRDPCKDHDPCEVDVQAVFKRSA